ncbi:MAG: serine hydrolase [Frankiaceae bacterium]
MPLKSRTEPSRLFTLGLLAIVSALAFTTACLPPPTPVTRPFPTDAYLRSYFASRPGTESIAVYDATSGITYAYGPGTRFHTASTIKVAILGSLLLRAQNAKRPLTANERTLAARMIEFSDNAATDVLWSAIGNGTGLSRFMAQIGMRHTVPGPGPYWILTETTTVDLTMLMRAVAYPNFVLANDSRAYILQLMGNVTVSQRWGVSAAVRPGQRVALKNGWMVVQHIWGINSMGRIWGSGRDFVIAVLTNGSPTKNVGIATVEGGTRVAMRGL